VSHAARSPKVSSSGVRSSTPTRSSAKRSIFTLALASLADSLARIHPSLAIQVAAIAESDAITPSSPFTVYATLGHLAQEHPAEVAAAHARAATMSYEDAIAFVFDAIDRLIAEHRPPATAS
jgi:hypothetical protein